MRRYFLDFFWGLMIGFLFFFLSIAVFEHDLTMLEYFSVQFSFNPNLIISVAWMLAFGILIFPAYALLSAWVLRVSFWKIIRRPSSFLSFATGFLLSYLCYFIFAAYAFSLTEGPL